MWSANWRNDIWSTLGQTWDVIIIGGGITGAGILREASRIGLKSLLVEQRDFAWGTSSRSSKLVHGGLRYLKQGQFMLTRASVQEREELLHEGPGLIDPLGFLLTVYKGDFPGRWTYELGLSIYDLLALQWDHEYYSPQDFQMLAPHIDYHGLQGGFRYGDAQTDDARLVLRLIREAVFTGGRALNYARVESLLRANNQVVGVRILDKVQDRWADVRAQAVINATGAWADVLRCQLAVPPRIRPLRGSHLIFPAWRLPVAQAVGFLHPVDHRPMFIIPWEGITLVGTTDVDHGYILDEEPRISPAEVAYLMAAVDAQFPSLGIGLGDVISTYAGVRPIIGSGNADPSKESRDHVVWEECGLLTVTGGKLTTFRLLAHAAIRAICNQAFPERRFPEIDTHTPILEQVDANFAEAVKLDENQRRKLAGRYGMEAGTLVTSAAPGELQPIQGTQTLWAELRWAARSEGVVHLEDLMLRRVRLGLLLPRGGEAILPSVRKICQAELDWDDTRWETEVAAYRKLYQHAYSLPDPRSIPDWKLLLAQATRQRHSKKGIAEEIYHKRGRKPVVLFGALLLLAGGLAFRFWKRRRT